MSPYRIHIFGASGSGTSTLGQALAHKLSLKYLDADDYYWRQTDPPYTLKHPPEERVRRLRAEMDDKAGWLLSGSVVSWGDALLPLFSAAVFVTLPQRVRLHRLRERESQRYGDRCKVGGDMYRASKAFLEWAALYDIAGVEIRSRAMHEAWLQGLECPVLRLESLRPASDLADEVIAALAYQRELPQ